MSSALPSAVLSLHHQHNQGPKALQGLPPPARPGTCSRTQTNTRQHGGWAVQITHVLLSQFSSLGTATALPTPTAWRRWGGVGGHPEICTSGSALLHTSTWPLSLLGSLTQDPHSDLETPSRLVLRRSAAGPPECEEGHRRCQTWFSAGLLGTSRQDKFSRMSSHRTRALR